MAAWVVFVAVLGSERADSCGPDFPNWLLAQGDQAVLVAPEGNFAAELARMNPGKTRIRATPPLNGQGYAAQSAEAELTDLRRALKEANIPEEQVNRICAEHQRQRLKLQEFIEAQPESNTSDSDSGNLDDPVPSKELRPSTIAVPLRVQVVSGLPGEFADYFEGFIAWHNPLLRDKKPARTAWERLLARSENERRFKSVWAAFMLGKSWATAEPEKALAYFKQVRDLARQGCRDTLGLAAASLGLEARVYLHQSNYEGAIEVYLDQMASGDPTAVSSLAVASAEALAAEPEALRSLAKNFRTQKVITAYVISRESSSSLYDSKASDQEGQHAESASPAATWLKAVEEAGVKDVDSAEALALAAYRVGDMDAAARWILRAPGSLLAQWLQAKLLLRAGQLQAAAALLARISPRFPILHEGTNAPASLGRKDTLTVNGNSYYRTSAARQVQGELGVLRLSRGEYVQALDSLLNAGFWMDAAYVAERVLTLQELKSYVDRFWPGVSAEQIAEEQERFASSDVCPRVLREQIRYLLARRLTRESHSDQAREYYPAAWVSSFDQMMAALRAAYNEHTSPSDRAGAFFQSAMLTRTNGMELLGTEVGPDWHYHDGQFDWGVSGESRGSNELARIVHASNDEMLRNAEHHPDPDARFHYRYQAASLAWEAARLLPDNDDTTAYVLWQGGSFIKNRDPQLADVFYKALVRRNRRTILGEQADRQRWFPSIDENGNIMPKKSRAIKPQELEPPSSMEPAEEPKIEDN